MTNVLLRTSVGACTIVLLGSAAALASCSTQRCIDTGTCAASVVSPDAAVADDSKPDADVAAGPVDPCNPLTRGDAFCWDFSDDAGTNSSGTRTPEYVTHVIETGGGASVAFSTELFRSPPRAGRVQLGARGAERSAELVFVGSFPSKTQHVRFASSLYIDELPSIGDVRLNALVLADPIGQPFGRFSVSLNAGSAALVQEALRDNGAGTELFKQTPVPLSRTIPVKTWTRLSIEVSTAEPQFVRVELDGIELANRTVAVVGRIQSIQAVAGMSADTDANDAAMFVDDIAIEHLP